MERNDEIPHSEAELICEFKRLFAPSDSASDLLVGIGDDAAVIEPGSDPDLKIVLTADMLVENVHFRRSIHSAYNIGWRTAVANLSDIAAMGAYPRWGICTLAVPEDISKEWIMEFAAGLKDAMLAHESYIIGGDLTRSKDNISVSMTLYGETVSRFIARSGAQLGDYIAVTGTLGASGAGLVVLEAINKVTDKIGGKESQIIDKIDNEIIDKLIQKHLKPEPRIWPGIVLAGNDGIHSMMDISDGLGIDLGRLCNASKVGARLREEFIPFASGVKEVAKVLGCDPLDFVNSGEDFELLITGSIDALKQAASILAEDKNQPQLTVIGEIIDPNFGIIMLREDGSVVDPSDLGWDHFRK